jgi:hypothetical protein
MPAEPRWSRLRREGILLAVMTAVLLALAGTLLMEAPALGAAVTSQASTTYQLSLGDSFGLASGAGASVPANDYVNLVSAHERASYPNLQVEDLACGGATTNSMIDASSPADQTCPSYAGGTQLGGAGSIFA